MGGCNIKINWTSYIEPLIKDLIPSFEQMSPDTRMKLFFLDLGKEYNKQTSVLGLLFKFIYQQGWAAKQGHWYLKLLKLLGRNLQSFKTIFFELTKSWAQKRWHHIRIVWMNSSHCSKSENKWNCFKSTLWTQYFDISVRYNLKNCYIFQVVFLLLWELWSILERW